MNSTSFKLEQHDWTGFWIFGGKGNDFEPATSPVFRKVFSAVCTGKTEIILCGLGWHELYVNGIKADDRVLSPAPTQYHQYASYILYDVTSLIRKGPNVLAIWLGKSFLLTDSNDCWGFSHADWKDYPKLICDVICDGKTILSSDETWKFCDSPIVYNGIRTGEIYDARLEIPGFSNPDFDDSSWFHAVPCNPPGGDILREIMPPCRIQKTLSPVKCWMLKNGDMVYDFGVTLTGWCRIKVKGNPGDTVKMYFGELLDEADDVSRANIVTCNRDDRTQVDTYILHGGTEETWEPRFTYHGFRYVKVSGMIPTRIEACFIHTDFPQIGSFKSSSEMLNQLQACTIQSYLNNFTGFPTDCPHREKNGWTGDAQIASETGLWNFDAATSYNAFLRTVKASQRKNGQLPGFAPNPGGSCYNWGNGPAWDIALFEIPYRIWLFTGETAPIQEHYEAMKAYIGYARQHESDHLVNYGLGDWCGPEECSLPPVKFAVSAYYFRILQLMTCFAELMGHPEDAAICRTRADQVQESFLRHYYHSAGEWANNSMTALGLPLYFGMISGDDAKLTLQKLVQTVREKHHHSEFGILGAKSVPRVLADNGYAEDAYKMITQEEYPGWGHWIKLGATTLWENWNGKESRDHIMFGDISAWMYQYLGGIVPLECAPGFRKFRLSPCVIPSLAYAVAEHKTPFGKIVSEWKREKETIQFHFEIPAGTEAEFVYGNTRRILSSETANISLSES